VKFLSGVSAQ